MAQNCGVQLVGGDSTRGPLSLTMTVFGRVPAGKALTRSVPAGCNLTQANLQHDDGSQK